MKSILLVMTAAFTILGPVMANADMYNADYQSTSPASSYNWASFKSYGLGAAQQTDSFRDLTWFTHGDMASPSFTTVNGVTLRGNSNVAIGSYIKWGMTGGGAMPPMPVVMAIQSGTVTPELLAANPMTPKAIDAPRDYSVSTTNVMEGLQTIVLQLRTSTIFPAGSHYTPFELGQMSAPVVLSLNGGAISLNWDYRSLDHVSTDMFSTSYTQEVWSFQWDLSNIGVAITDFSVNFEMFPYGNVTGVQIDQGNSAIQVVPEPSTYALLAFGLGLAIWHTSRKRLSVQG